MTEPLKPNQRVVAGELCECTGLYVSPELHRALQELKRAENRSMNGLIVQLLRESFEQPATKGKKRTHLQLPSGAMVRVRSDIDPRTLEALDEMMRAAVKALGNK